MSAQAATLGKAGDMEPTGPTPKHLTPARVGIYMFLAVSAIFFLIPLWVMIVTSLKTMDEVRLGYIFAWPIDLTVEPWIKAWTSACTGLACEGVRVGFWNSIRILIPSVFVSVFIGCINGYTLSFWRPRFANVLFAVLLVGVFIPFQVFIYPLVQLLSKVGLFGSLGGIVLVHTAFGMPIMTLLFRNYYAGLPIELFKAARVDGAGFFYIFFKLMIPMSVPIMVVAMILQVTGIWNDFIFGLVFAGLDNLPMTVQLNNIVNSQFGEKAHNVDMAATILTAIVPLLVYFFSGRLFVRGIAAGALKG